MATENQLTEHAFKTGYIAASQAVRVGTINDAWAHYESSTLPWLRSQVGSAEPPPARCLICKGKGWVTPSIKMYPGDRVACSRCASEARPTTEENPNDTMAIQNDGTAGSGRSVDLHGSRGTAALGVDSLTSLPPEVEPRPHSARSRVIQAGWDGLQGDDEAEGGGSADGYLAAAREALTLVEEVIRDKFTAALNTGTAFDMLVLVGQAHRELRAELTLDGSAPVLEGEASASPGRSEAQAIISCESATCRSALAAQAQEIETLRGALGLAQDAAITAIGQRDAAEARASTARRCFKPQG